MEINKIYNEDCLIGMDKIPDGIIDMILCDLPYGTTDAFWDKRIPFEPLWEQYKRITKKNAAIVLFSQMPFGAELIMSNLKMFRYEWIWRKTNGIGFLNANKMPLRIHENILVFYRKLPIYNPQKWQGKPYIDKRRNHAATIIYSNFAKESISNLDGMRFPLDVIEFNNANRFNNFHSTQKPVDLLEYLIKTYTNEGETVLDNCIGSGSTAVACVNTGRNFIGFETEKEYFDIACRRVEKAQAAKGLELAL